MGSSKSKYLNLNIKNTLKEEPKEIVKIEGKDNISEEIIEKFIEDILKDQKINIEYLPDAVEKKIYKNVLLLVFALLNKTLDNTSIKFIGHEIKFSLEISK